MAFHPLCSHLEMPAPGKPWLDLPDPVPALPSDAPRPDQQVIRSRAVSRETAEQGQQLVSCTQSQLCA